MEIELKSAQQTPFIKDFTYFRSRFAAQQKTVKKQMIAFGAMVEAFKRRQDQDDLENAQVSGLMVQVNQKSEGIQMEIDDMQELFMEIEKLNNLSMLERAQQQKLKNCLKELQHEHTTLRKILKHQLRDQSGRASMNSKLKNSNRLSQLIHENGSLDSSLQQAEEIIRMGSDS